MVEASYDLHGKQTSRRSLLVGPFQRAPGGWKRMRPHRIFWSHLLAEVVEFLFQRLLERTSNAFNHQMEKKQSRKPFKSSQLPSHPFVRDPAASVPPLCAAAQQMTCLAGCKRTQVPSETVPWISITTASQIGTCFKTSSIATLIFIFIISVTLLH